MTLNTNSQKIYFSKMKDKHFLSVAQCIKKGYKMWVLCRIVIYLLVYLWPVYRTKLYDARWNLMFGLVLSLTDFKTTTRACLWFSRNLIQLPFDPDGICSRSRTDTGFYSGCCEILKKEKMFKKGKRGNFP